MLWLLYLTKCVPYIDRIEFEQHTLTAVQATLPITQPVRTIIDDQSVHCFPSYTNVERARIIEPWGFV